MHRIFQLVKVVICFSVILSFLPPVILSFLPPREELVMNKNKGGRQYASFIKRVFFRGFCFSQKLYERSIIPAPQV